MDSFIGKIEVIRCKNDYEQLTEAEGMISNLYPNVALVVKNEKLLQKFLHRLKLRNIPISNERAPSLDSLFLFYTLDLYLYPESGRFLLQLIKHPYIYNYNKDAVDDLEKNFIRRIRSSTNNFLLEKIRDSLKLFDGTNNFAQAHLKIVENLTTNFSVSYREMLEFISKNLESDLQEYRSILSFFVKRMQKNIFAPENASFILEDNIVLIDCTEESLDLKNERIAYSLFQISNSKNAFFLYNEQSRVSRFVLQLNKYERW